MKAVLSAVVALLATTAALPAAAPADTGSRDGLPLLDRRGTAGPAAPAQRARRALGDVREAPAGGIADLRRRNGFLTRGSARDPEAIALDYVREHRAAFGLDDGDLRALRRTARATSPSGITTVRWIQTYDGIASFDTGLIAHVDPRGRLIGIGGGAVPDFAARDVEARLGPSTAYREALADAGAQLVAPRARTEGGSERRTRFSDGGEARLAILADGDRTRLVWRTLAADEDGLGYEQAIDADTGDVRFRRPLAAHVANANVFPRFPGAPAGGQPVTVDLEADPTWLDDSTGDQRLKGNNTHTYNDRNNSNAPDAGEDVAASGTGVNRWTFPFTPVGGTPCPPVAPAGDAYDVCTWNSADPSTLGINQNNAATNLFYNVNRFHDHLLAGPIGFDEASGNFERVNSTGEGRGGDSVQAENNDGASVLNEGGGVLNVNNAFFNTPPDGFEPTMSMWPRTTRDLTSGHNAETAFHEYTHGLTNRLVVDASGSSTLVGEQARAMGEGWSDWYALDLLNAAGVFPDNPGLPGEVNYATYWNGTGIRSQAIDCEVPNTGGRCGSGGYTYEDIQTLGLPHTAGEMWAQTLWSIRYAVGSTTARQLVTDALRISPPDPTYVDQRDAIIAADLAVNDGANHETLWTVFARRGLGGGATSARRRAASAEESFDLPRADVGDVRMDAETTGDRDGVMEPGETARLTPELVNTSFGALGASSGTLSSLTPGLSVSDGQGDWPALTEGASAFGSPFAITAGNGITCGSRGRLSLGITTTLGTATIPLPVQVGPRGGTVDSGLGVYDGFYTPSTIELPAGLGTVTDVNVFIDDLEHAEIGDVDLRLLHGPPDDMTTVVLSTHPGGFSNDGDDMVETVFDDEATGSIPGMFATVTGRYRPQQPLSAFDGQDSSGAWELRVADLDFNDEEGVLHGWGLNRPDGSGCEDNTAGATSGAATGVGETSATLNGDVDPNGVATEFRFVYGTTDAYGSVTPAQSAGGGGVSAAVGGLAPGTTYHYRVQALRFGEVAAEGADTTFTTPAAPPQEGPPSIGPPIVNRPQPPNPAPQFTRTARSVRARRGRFAFVFDALPNATGTVTFRSGRTVLARSRFRAAANGRVKLNVKLSKKAARLLKRRKRLRVVASVTAGTGRGKVTFTLRR